MQVKLGCIRLRMAEILFAFCWLEKFQGLVTESRKTGGPLVTLTTSTLDIRDS